VVAANKREGAMADDMRYRMEGATHHGRKNKVAGANVTCSDPLSTNSRGNDIRFGLLSLYVLKHI
jgi:hypothetical protein